MNNPVIRVSELSKSYLLSGNQTGPRYKTLRDEVKRIPRALSSFFSGSKQSAQLYWALDGVTFDVAEGEIVGVIGRNGAGKSTLLKILSRIVEPTKGEADIHGRVGSLLEVGTGFHPELTGKENIYLSGAIMGMRRKEVHVRFDQIVDFAEVGQFIETPCKHYSSGMYMRLAFAVAAHLDPEILIIDEVLAVGDAAFQEKCVGKIQEMSKGHGRTILFVSHNMAAIQKLCNKALVLEKGKVVELGTVSHCVQSYLRTVSVGESDHTFGLSDLLPGRKGDRTLEFKTLRISDTNRVPRSHFAFTEPFKLNFEIKANRFTKDYILGFSINSLDGTPIICSNHYDFLNSEALPVGLHEFSVTVENVSLSPGVYTLTAALTSADQQASHDFCPDCGRFRIDARLPEGPMTRYPRMDNRPGYLRPMLNWKKSV